MIIHRFPASGDVQSPGRTGALAPPEACFTVVRDNHSAADSRFSGQINSPATSESRLKGLFNASPDGIVVVARDGFICEANAAALQFFEADTVRDLAAAPLGGFICPEYHGSFAACLDALWEGHKRSAEFELLGRNGARRWVDMHAAPVLGQDGQILSFVAILRDTAQRRELNKQFIQAQKMEVVGHLASGVAHDFNNLIGIIMGYSEMLIQSAAPGSHQLEDALVVFQTAERAAALTQQILIFSRNGTPEPQKVDLGAIIVQMDRMLRRLIGENITLATKPDPDLSLIEADPGQVEQVLMNLTVNARDAMQNGGALTIETSNATVTEGDPAHPGVPPGKFVVLSVADTGDGMTEEVRARIFNAFYTTKPAGQGTGLGLSTCQSIVQFWHGYFAVESKPGAGSTFKVYLPAIARSAKADTSNPQSQSAPPPRGVETILLVEDEPGLLALTAIVLQRQGYTVLKAGNGNEALSVVHARRRGDIDLVMTDMVMPEMGGRMMAEWLRAFDPQIKVLFTSGYTDVGHGGGIEAGMDFIPKPYTPTDLLHKVREAIDRSGPKPAALSLPETAA
jgi:PAS domain S-box-containing protein